MATGQQQGGGLFSKPDVPDLGPLTWTEMGGVHPDSPLVGGRGAPYAETNPRYRQVATGSPPNAAAAATPVAAPMTKNWKQLFNFKGNPLGWVLIVAIAYLGLTHIHASAGVHAGGRYG